MMITPPKAPLTCDASPVKGATVEVALVVMPAVGAVTPELAAVVTGALAEEAAADDAGADEDAGAALEEAARELEASADELGTVLLLADAELEAAELAGAELEATELAGADDELPEPEIAMGPPADWQVCSTALAAARRRVRWYLHRCVGGMDHTYWLDLGESRPWRCKAESARRAVA